MKQSYQPSEAILAKYADLIVRFGMQTPDGKRLPKGSVVQFIVPEVAKPLYVHLQRAILKNGYHPLGVFKPSPEENYNIDADFFTYASKDQLAFLPKKQIKGLIDQIDGTIHIIAETDPQALRDVDPKKILFQSQQQKAGRTYRWKKIEAGKLAWTIALYGTDAMAQEAGLSTKAYWRQIEKACYLDATDPVKEWRRIDREVKRLGKKLTDMQIESLHWTGKDMDITVGIGADRKWASGGGCNIPSYEVFTSPDYRRADGWIRFNQPHYRYGKKIEGIELWFEGGKVVRSKASKHHDLLKSMLKTPGGDQLGEISLTDADHSRITKFMAEILYDENTGGKYGNTHMAIGASFHECYNGKPDSTWKDADWQKRGFNHSVVHSDLISTTDRTVTATLQDGTKKVIYKNGHFTI